MSKTFYHLHHRRKLSPKRVADLQGAHHIDSEGRAIQAPRHFSSEFDLNPNKPFSNHTVLREHGGDSSSIPAPGVPSAPPCHRSPRLKSGWYNPFFFIARLEESCLWLPGEPRNQKQGRFGSAAAFTSRVAVVVGETPVVFAGQWVTLRVSAAGLRAPSALPPGD